MEPDDLTLQEIVWPPRLHRHAGLPGRRLPVFSYAGFPSSRPERPMNNGGSCVKNFRQNLRVSNCTIVASVKECRRRNPP